MTYMTYIHCLRHFSIFGSYNVRPGTFVPRHSWRCHSALSHLVHWCHLFRSEKKASRFVLALPFKSFLVAPATWSYWTLALGLFVWYSRTICLDLGLCPSPLHWLLIQCPRHFSIFGSYNVRVQPTRYFRTTTLVTLSFGLHSFGTLLPLV